MAKGKTFLPWEILIDMWELLFIKKEALYTLPAKTLYSEHQLRKSKKRYMGLSFAEWSMLPRHLQEAHPKHLQYARNEKRHLLELLEEEKRTEEREGSLLSGLNQLQRMPPPCVLPDPGWDWSSGEPRKRAENITVLDVELPDTPEIENLLQYLEADDPVLIGFQRTVEASANYRRKCSDFYEELISAAQIVSEEMGIPLTSQRRVPISALTPGFVGTVYEIAGKLISRNGGSGSYSSEPDPFGAANGLLQLSYGIPIAFVMPGEMEQVEDNHRKLCASLDDARSPSLNAVKEAGEICKELVKKLNVEICLKGAQIRSVAFERQSGEDSPKQS